ncbi:hypothetical protein HDZ31DRAFT_42228 [Schizophyllum fasciatum]
MVFTNLGPQEKDAFFTLLDEYFASRPDVFGGQQGASATQAATRAMHAAPGVISAGVGKATTFGKGVAAYAQSHQSQVRVPAHAGEKEAHEEPSASVSSRIKAFSSSHHSPSSSHDGGQGGAGSRGSMSQIKKFGDVDMSSAGKMFGSLRHSNASKQETFTPPRTAPAFTPKPNTYGPPPVRHIEPEPEPEPEPEAQGEWVEILYDYSSSEPGDLQCKEGQRVLLVERTSDDWWTGEFNGQRGLFPASYCKLL